MKFFSLHAEKKLDEGRNLSIIVISLLPPIFCLKPWVGIHALNTLVFGPTGTGRKARELQRVKTCTRPYSLRVLAPVRAVIFDTLVLFVLFGGSVILVSVLTSLALLEEPTLDRPNDINNNIIFHFELSSLRAPTCRISRCVQGISVCLVILTGIVAQIIFWLLGVTFKSFLLTQRAEKQSNLSLFCFPRRNIGLKRPASLTQHRKVPPRPEKQFYSLDVSEFSVI